MAKLFDSMARLKFKLDSEEKPLKVGLGMYSKEDEYVDFDQECDLSGQVGRSNFKLQAENMSIDLPEFLEKEAFIPMHVVSKVIFGLKTGMAKACHIIIWTEIKVSSKYLLAKLNITNFSEW